MSSDETRTPSSTGPSTGSSSKQSGDQSHSSSQSQASTFDTQPPSSQEPSDTISQAWGQLAVIGSSTCYELIKNEYKIGRGKDCDIILRNNERPTLTSTLWKACSKQHFLIYMENKRSGRYIFLKDLSSNGTVVNEDFIGSGKFTVISSGDVISLVDKDHKAFLFLDFMHKENDDVPNLVKAKYRVLSDLGSGACGLVKLAVRKSDCLRVACKCIDKSKFNFPSNSSKVQLMKEVSILKALDHPCVIKVVDVIDTEKMLCIFMELAEAGDLFKEIKLQTRLEPDHAKMVFYQTCLAVKHLHDHNVVHRDLKPENILLSNTLQSYQIVKVTDFGYSCVMDTSSLLKTLCGTPYYIAPEIVVSHGMGGGYTKAVDCWSLGVILYVCITGQPAFTTERKDLCLKDQILQGSYIMKDKYWEHIPGAKDLVKKLLVVDPEKRITLEDALQHPWFQDDKDMLQKVQKLLNLESSVEEAEKMDHEDVQDRKRRRLGEDNDFRDESTTPLLKDKISKKLEKDETSMSISGDSLASASVMETTTSCSPNEKQMST